MSFLNGWHERAKHLLRRRDLEREMEEEMEFHLEQEQARREGTGTTPEDARRAALLTFGSGERFREEVRDTWTGSLFGGAMQDVRLGLRRLVKRPGFTVVALCTLGLAVGANTAMFSLVRGVLLTPFPYGEPDRLVMVWKASGSQTDETWLSARELVEYRMATRSFTELAAHTNFNANLTDEMAPERVRASAVTANMFSTLGTPALRGRTFAPEEDVSGADDVVVLGHELWQRRFGGAAMIGEAIRVNGRARRVVGIMPAGFQLPLDYRDERPTELWVPAAIDPAGNLSWGNRSYYIVGRLAAGVTADQATADLERVLGIWEDADYITNADGSWIEPRSRWRACSCGVSGRRC